ncbi:regulator [Leisingera methylohalidivorans DSM 14336]|uniref:Regulator n=1 Tax=Leisingera methylohalidivorans DSM 14336 TaxID=999552 RepID=V9VU16_9RHOB|nr:regulator [Leisingera methylohalidivorans DSM 14336]
MLNSTDKIIKHKTGLLNLAKELGNVSKACQVMGNSRDTFHRYKSAVEDGGVEALFERTRYKPNLANPADDATEQAVTKPGPDFPAYGQARTSNELRKLGVFVFARRDDGMRAARGNRIAAFAGVISPVCRDTAEVLIGRELVKQLRQHGRVTNITGGDFDCANFQRFCVDPDVHLTPDPPFRATMLASHERG